MTLLLHLSLGGLMLSLSLLGLLLGLLGLLLRGRLGLLQHLLLKHLLLDLMLPCRSGRADTSRLGRTVRHGLAGLAWLPTTTTTTTARHDGDAVGRIGEHRFTLIVLQ